MTHPLGRSYNFVALGNPTQQVGGVGNPLLSLPTELLDTITGCVARANTPQEAAAHAIRWGQVCVSTHLMTHEPRINTVITHARHLDEALIILWNHIAPHLASAPQMNTAREIRRWMRDPNNAPVLNTVNEVTLSKGELKAIPPEINTLRNLRELCLNHNQITQIDSQAFAGCRALRHLHLNNNQITQVDPQAFAGCQALLELHLESNLITQVDPQTFADCQALRHLHLNHNQITQVDPQAFAGCQALLELHLESNLITQVDPQTFADCQALLELYLNHNQITQVGPEVFASCPALEWLHLESNQITRVDPKAFAGCLSLRELHLNNNQIAQIFAGCLSLLALHLYNNQIAQVGPLTFAGYPALERLNLGGNKIAQIDPETFAGCLSLQYLRLNHNQITQVGPQAFAGCWALEWLYINNNQIAQVDPLAFAGCLSLQYLHLGSNKIAQVGPQAFAGCQALQELYLYDNLLLCAFAPYENCLGRFNAFSSYVCRSALAAFYQAVSEGRLLASEIVEHLKQLEDRNQIYRMVYWEAEAAARRQGRAFSTEGDPQWGEHHVCDDMPIFYRALQELVKQKFYLLPTEQWDVIYDKIYLIAREDEELALDDPAGVSPDRWGRDHREENVLRCIDAMEGVKK